MRKRRRWYETAAPLRWDSSKLKLEADSGVGADVLAAVVGDAELVDRLAVACPVRAADREGGAAAVDADTSGNHRTAGVHRLRHGGGGEARGGAGARGAADVADVEVQRLKLQIG